MKGSFNNRQCGFTLIETIIAVVIISIITALANIAFGRMGGGRKVHAQAKQLEQVVLLARQQAILMPAVLGLKITEHGYAFYYYQINRIKHQGHWLKLPDQSLSKADAFTGQVRGMWVHKASDDQKKKKEKYIIFSSSGDVTPFKIIIRDLQGSHIYTLSMSPAGKLKLNSKVAG